MKRLKKTVMLLIVMLVLILPSIEFAQSGLQEASFTSRCDNCWPEWTELARPRNGVGPRVERGSAYIFINGSKPDPALN
jgi:hypothetical protein